MTISFVLVYIVLKNDMSHLAEASEISGNSSDEVLNQKIYNYIYILHIYIYIYIYIYTYIYIYMCVCVCMCACVFTYMYTCTHTGFAVVAFQV